MKSNLPRFAEWPSFEFDEVLAVMNVLRSGKVNQWTGSEVRAFEDEFARYLGVSHAIALANGSLALDLALIILGIGPGDEIVVTPRTFVASASCIALRGGIPVFAEVDPVSQNLNIDSVQKCISPKTKAVIAVHLAGWPCDLDKLRKICDENGLYLIEDCAQAHGARYKRLPVGSFGDFSAFSFCQDKIMTTGGEGGMLVTNNEDLWKRAWSFKDHGKDFGTVFHDECPPGFRWLVKSFGTNYRMTEMQAAIGRIQLKKLDLWVRKRRRLAEVLSEGFKNIPSLRNTSPSEDEFHSYYKYYIFVRPELLKKGWSRDRILFELTEMGIPCGTGICPEVYLEEAFKNYIWRTSYGDRKRLKIAKYLGETSIMLLVHPTLDESNMVFIIEKISGILRKATI